jgi:hypothetical protein
LTLGTKIDLPGPRNLRGIEDVIADLATSGQRWHHLSETDTNRRPAPGPSVAVSFRHAQPGAGANNRVRWRSFLNNNRLLRCLAEFETAPEGQTA